MTFTGSGWLATGAASGTDFAVFFFFPFGATSATAVSIIVTGLSSIEVETAATRESDDAAPLRAFVFPVVAFVIGATGSTTCAAGFSATFEVFGFVALLAEVETGLEFEALGTPTGVFAGDFLGVGAGAVVSLGFVPTVSFGVFGTAGLGVPFGAGVIVAFFGCFAVACFNSGLAGTFETTAFLATDDFAVAGFGMGFGSCAFGDGDFEPLTFAGGVVDARFAGGLLITVDRDVFFAVLFAFDDTIDSLLRATMRPLGPIRGRRTLPPVFDPSADSAQQRVSSPRRQPWNLGLGRRSDPR